MRPDNPRLVFTRLAPFFIQTLQDLLAHKLQTIGADLPILTHTQLWRLVQDADLDLDEEELQQVKSN